MVKISRRCVVCLEERVLLQKLLLLCPYCSRLWFRLGEITISSTDTCTWCQELSVDSKAILDYNRHAYDSLSFTSSVEGCSSLCNGSDELTTSVVSEELITDSYCIDFALLSTGDGPVQQFDIPTNVLQSVTCFVAAA